MCWKTRCRPRRGAERTGPSCRLTGDEDDDRRCLDCGGQTKLRPIHLVVLIEPNLLMPADLPSRWCDACDILVVHERGVEPVVRAAPERQCPESAGDVVVVADVAMRGRATGERDPKWIIEQVGLFREDFPCDAGDWDWLVDKDLTDRADDHDPDPTPGGVLGPIALPPRRS